MKIRTIIFVTTTLQGEVVDMQAHSQGVNYAPITISKVNGIYRAIFEIEGDEDKTPTLSMYVSDGIRIGERLG